ncbi:MAG: geranyl-CoA carboxylase beta subunit [Cognaticolwellia sp.]|jgi:geranyl-CoA carboxylase beta subunit
MPTLSSSLNPKSAAFQENTARMQERLDEIRALEAQVRATSAKRKARFEARGQLIPRERVERLLDPGTPFLELSTLAGLAMHDDDGKRTVMGGGSIAGIGTVSGKRVVVLANDSGIKGGSISPMGAQKTLRLQEIARKHKLPVVYLVESGGANLLYQSEMFVGGGRSFANLARLSAAGIPQISVVHGSSTAGGAYLPGLSDYVVLVAERSKIFLAGPPLVKAAIGEDTTDEALGGAELHATVTGLGEYVADNDAHALETTRELMDLLKWDSANALEEPAPKGHEFSANARLTAPKRQGSSTQSIAEPAFNAEELMGIVPASDSEPYDCREIIARLVDASQFLEFKAAFGSEIVCGHARIQGESIGIVANNGAIQPNGSAKATHFLQACDQSGTPVVFLQNTTGYMVGSTAERAGSIKHGSKMIQAVANLRVPKLTIVVGGSFGAGNYGMCGRGFDPNFLFSWPSARCAVMGGSQAATVMEIITRQAYAKKGLPIAEDFLAHMSEKIKTQLDAESHVLFGTARLWDDGVIDPRDTRTILGMCLRICAAAQSRDLHPNAFGVARP